MIIDEDAIIEALKMYIKIPVFRESIAHKVKQWEGTFKEAIEKYKQIVKVIDPVEQKETSETVTETNTNFVMEKVATGFIVKPVLTEKKTPSKSARITPLTSRDKTEILKTILLYLLECDEYLKSTYDQLNDKWKPLIDKGILKNNIIER